MEKIAAHPQFSRRPHTAAAAVPPGLRVRCISATARVGSGTYIKPRALRTTSKLSSSMGKILRIGSFEGNVCGIEFSRPSPRALNHFVGNIHSDHASLGSGHFCRPKCHEARAAGNIQHLIARTNSREREHAGLRGLELIPPGALVVVRGAVPAISLNSSLEPGIHRESRTKRGAEGRLRLTGWNKLDDSLEILGPPVDVEPGAMGVGFVQHLPDGFLRGIALNFDTVAHFRIAWRHVCKTVEAPSIIVGLDLHFDCFDGDAQFRRPIRVVHRKTRTQRSAAEGAWIRPRVGASRAFRNARR